MIRPPRLLLAAALGVAASFGAASGQEGDGAARETPAIARYEAEVSYRPRYSSSSADAERTVLWELRRARFQAGATIAGRLQTRVQVDHRSGDWSVADAWLRLTLPRGASLLAGRAKSPLTAITARSGGSAGPIERGGSIRGAAVLEEQNLLRHVGIGQRALVVQLAGPVPATRGRLDYVLAVQPPYPAGGGSARDPQATVRIATRPFPGLVTAVAWNTRARTDLTDPAAAAVRENAFAIDVEYGAGESGLQFLAELVAGEAGIDSLDGYWGAQTWVLYAFSPPRSGMPIIEPLLRLSVAGFEPPGGTLRGGVYSTVGVTLYPGERENGTRLMIGYDVWHPWDGSRDTSLKAQLQLAL